MLNTAVADSLAKLADELEKLKPGDFDGLTAILSKIVGANKQVLFEGNGYSEEWHAEAAKRGLPNNRTTVDALPSLTTAKAKKLFSSFGVLSERELASRVEINWERYVKVSNIEANCALDMARTMILPATAQYLGHLAAAPLVAGHRRGREDVAGLADELVDAIDALEHAQHEAHEAGSVQKEARAFVDQVIPAQNALREVADELEPSWPTTSGRCPSTASCSSSSETKPAGGGRIDGIRKPGRGPLGRVYPCPATLPPSRPQPRPVQAVGCKETRWNRSTSVVHSSSAPWSGSCAPRMSAPPK